MPARKMRVEVYDELGNRYTITFEGRVTRDKALRVFDIIELLGGMPGVDHELEGTNEQLSKIMKVYHTIEKNFPIVWFNAKEAKLAYEKEFNESISLSTISTYLSRLSDRALLAKKRSSNKVHYRLVSENLQKILSLKNLK